MSPSKLRLRHLLLLLLVLLLLPWLVLLLLWCRGCQRRRGRWLRCGARC